MTIIYFIIAWLIVAFFGHQYVTRKRKIKHQKYLKYLDAQNKLQKAYWEKVRGQTQSSLETVSRDSNGIY